MSSSSDSKNASSFYRYSLKFCKEIVQYYQECYHWYQRSREMFQSTDDDWSNTISNHKKHHLERSSSCNDARMRKKNKRLQFQTSSLKILFKKINHIRASIEKFHLISVYFYSIAFLTSSNSSSSSRAELERLLTILPFCLPSIWSKRFLGWKLMGATRLDLNRLEKVNTSYTIPIAMRTHTSANRTCMYSLEWIRSLTDPIWMVSVKQYLWYFFCVYS